MGGQKMPMTKITIQHRVLQYVRMTQGPVTTDQVAKGLDIAWQTAQLNLLTLANQEKIKFRKIGRQNVFVKNAERNYESSDEYRQIFEQNPQPSWIFDRETLALLAVNDAMVHLLGFSREKLLEMTLFDLLESEDDRSLLRLRMHRKKGFDELALTTYRTLGIWRLQRQSGDIVYVDIRARTMQFKNHLANYALVQPVDAHRPAQLTAQENRVPLVASLPSIIWTSRWFSRICKQLLV